MNGSVEEYPLCNEPISVFESQRQNKKTLTNVFVGIGEAYQTMKNEN
jgi:hypothetical protein